MIDQTRPVDGRTIAFRAASANTGVVAVQREWLIVTVKKNGKPVKSGDIKPGQAFRVNKKTGEMEEV